MAYPRYFRGVKGDTNSPIDLAGRGRDCYDPPAENRREPFRRIIRRLVAWPREPVGLERLGFERLGFERVGVAVEKGVDGEKALSSRRRRRPDAWAWRV